MKRRGFVFLEFLLALLFLLVIAGLAIVAVIRFVTGEFPWYAWLLGGIAPLCLLILIGLAYDWLELRYQKRFKKSRN